MELGNLRWSIQEKPDIAAAAAAAIALLHYLLIKVLSEAQALLGTFRSPTIRHSYVPPGLNPNSSFYPQSTLSGA
jgi:hypothetical protein